MGFVGRRDSKTGTRRLAVHTPRGSTVQNDVVDEYVPSVLVMQDFKSVAVEDASHVKRAIADGIRAPALLKEQRFFSMAWRGR